MGNVPTDKDGNIINIYDQPDHVRLNKKTLAKKKKK